MNPQLILIAILFALAHSTPDPIEVATGLMTDLDPQLRALYDVVTKRLGADPILATVPPSVEPFFLNAVATTTDLLGHLEHRGPEIEQLILGALRSAMANNCTDIGRVLDGEPAFDIALGLGGILWSSILSEAQKRVDKLQMAVHTSFPTIGGSCHTVHLLGIAQHTLDAVKILDRALGPLFDPKFIGSVHIILEPLGIFGPRVVDETIDAEILLALLEMPTAVSALFGREIDFVYVDHVIEAFNGALRGLVGDPEFIGAVRSLALAAIKSEHVGDIVGLAAIPFANADPLPCSKWHPDIAYDLCNILALAHVNNSVQWIEHVRPCEITMRVDGVVEGTGLAVTDLVTVGTQLKYEIGDLVSKLGALINGPEFDEVLCSIAQNLPGKTPLPNHCIIHA